MLVRKLNERDLAVRSKRTGVDPLVDIILADEECPEAKMYKKGLELKDSKVRRSYIEACLIATDDFEKIGELLGLPTEFVKFYEYVFFNIATLDRLERIELLDGENDSLKIWAFTQGLDFISWRLGRKVELSPVEGLKDLFNTCIYKSKEAMFNKNASEASREATKWVKLSIDIARLLKLWVMDSAAARKDLELALEKVVPDFKSLDDLDLDFDPSTCEFQRYEEVKDEE